MQGPNPYTKAKSVGISKIRVQLTKTLLKKTIPRYTKGLFELSYLLMENGTTAFYPFTVNNDNFRKNCSGLFLPALKSEKLLSFIAAKFLI